MKKNVAYPLKLTAALAMLAAISIICGKYLAIRGGDILRFSFENLPIIFAGVAFGPVAGALVGIVDETGHRSQGTFHQFQDLAHGIVFRSAVELIAAALAGSAGEQSARHHILDDDLQILLGDVLPFRYLFQGSVASVIVLRQIDHDTQCIASFRRDHLVFTNLFSIFAYYTAG